MTICDGRVKRIIHSWNIVEEKTYTSSNICNDHSILIQGKRTVTNIDALLVIPVLA